MKMSGCILIILATGICGLPIDVLPGTEKQPGETIPLGAVRYEAETQTIYLDGFFNMSQGFVEYLVNLPGAKAHETLIAVDCDPMHLQTALMLLEMPILSTQGRCGLLLATTPWQWTYRRSMLH